MTEVLQIYKCMVCGNIVEVLHTGVGKLVCCGQNMNLFAENTEDAAYEKHVPAVSREDGKVVVKIGSVPHPMEEEHYIEWVELIAGDRVYRHALAPGEDPEVVFDCVEDGRIVVREYCNIHGLWKTELAD